jgi:hypothetical protein
MVQEKTQEYLESNAGSAKPGRSGACRPPIKFRYAILTICPHRRGRLIGQRLGRDGPGPMVAYVERCFDATRITRCIEWPSDNG